MKIRNEKFSVKNHEGGMVTMLFIVLLAIMMILVATNVRTLVHLRVEENRVEQKQIERLNLSQTNHVAAASTLLANPQPR